MRRFTVFGSVLVIVLFALVAAISWVVASRGEKSPSPSDAVLAHSAPAVDVERLRPQVEAFCGDCHAPPPPQSFHRDAWFDEVEQGYRLYYESGRNDLQPLAMADVVRFYRQQAPAKLIFQPPPIAPGPPPVVFEKTALDIGGSPPPATASVLWTELTPGGSPGLLFCDMRTGDARWAASLHAGAPARILAKLANPCHAEPCDLDGDGRIDLVAADLGSRLADDHDRGRVVWLRPSADGAWEPRTLAESLGRVADVRPADFDGDGDQDLVVAEFGWRTTGGIHWLENRAGEFHRAPIDPRPGAVHTPVCDWNADGRLDFLALISQQYEAVVAFLNAGDGSFTAQTLWEAADPAYGSSGLELVDLDGDGDLDVLFANGDTLDSDILKPAHGVQWLENRGPEGCVHHRLAALPGVHGVQAGDFDGDGDLDVVATAFFPKVVGTEVERAQIHSLALLEQTAPGQFVYHCLERGRPTHAAVEAADFDHDGDLDFAVGVMMGAPAAEPTPRVEVWWNRGKP